MRWLAVPALTLLAACQTIEPPRPVASAAIVAPLIARNPAEAVKDDTIKANIARRLAEQGRPFRAVTVEAFGGRVLLMGAVIKPEQRRKAEQLAGATEGTTEVLNELVLAEDRALDVFTADTPVDLGREAALRRQLGLNGGTVARVINGVAFLLGTAATRDAAAALKAEATEVDGVKWVVSHLQAP